MKTPSPKVHMTRLARSLHSLDIHRSKGPNSKPNAMSKHSFPPCSTCFYTPTMKQKKHPFKRVIKSSTGGFRSERKSRKGSNLQAIPEHGEPKDVVDEHESLNSGPPPPALETVREVVQTRMVIRSMFTHFGEATVTEFFERIKSPLPTVDMIFTEELHSHWILNGDVNRLPTDDAGNRLVAVPAPEWGIVHSNESDETIWTSSYSNVLRKLEFVELSD